MDTFIKINYNVTSYYILQKSFNVRMPKKEREVPIAYLTKIIIKADGCIDDLLELHYDKRHPIILPAK